MDMGQQIILLILGILIGLFAGIIIGIFIQRYQSRPQPKPALKDDLDTRYGTVSPEEIHTLPPEEQEGQAQVCPLCGHVNSSSNLFCYDCGGRLH